MSEIEKILLTVACTTIANFIIFILSKIYYEPIKKYRELKARTNYLIIYYANIYNNPIDIANTNNKLPDDYKVAQKELRKISAEWNTFIYLKYVHMFGALKNKNLIIIYENLMGLSNSLNLPYRTNNEFLKEQKTEITERINLIKRILKLKS
ncbi:MAG: hypothetical protein E6Z74_07610 [Clostridium perfringens]|uniref:hypothetical protein n=1 Tax=Clostridium TaxID=1485 RepID=UPI0013E2BFBB|nr:MULTISPECIES: hypothetical protein [Clostridium]MDK0531444.1 hypothetical protein [Clostridium perfringens]MDK0701788.1 hypothetical protein [Clostridium perfringens]MDU5775774.1 hypothetical protein [Clostridium perfringens]MDU6274185.1 hypothetical protein [Clostridium sp.]NGS98852.1 hypothetical protein [Clostridium perfringens]